MEAGLACIASLLYNLAYIERWNDHPRPFHIAELDKQAHKSAIAYLIGKFEEIEGKDIDWDFLVKGLIFEAIHRSILTDIKPPIFHRIMREKAREVNDFVFREVKDCLRKYSEDFYREFTSYFSSPDEDDKRRLARRIIRASHFISTYWEFQMIYSVGIRFYGIEKVKEEIEDTVEEFFDLTGVERIYLKKKSYNFIDLVGQLRFQKRWIQSPRIPLTSVLGHMFMVASLSYLISLAVGACGRRRVLNFFTGLFHDLPEVTTRDIIRPVKEKAGIGEILKEYEREQVERVILPLLPEPVREEFSYILGFVEDRSVDEFSNRIRKNGKVIKLEAIGKEHNEDRFDPVDGELVKICDTIGAYIEAVSSISHGIRSRHLEEGRKEMRRNLRGVYTLNGRKIHMDELLRNLEEVLS